MSYERLLTGDPDKGAVSPDGLAESGRFRSFGSNIIKALTGNLKKGMAVGLLSVVAASGAGCSSGNTQDTDPTEQTQEALQKIDTVSEYSKEDQKAIKQLEIMTMADLEKKIDWTLKEAQEYFKDPTNTKTVKRISEFYGIPKEDVFDLNAKIIHNLLSEELAIVEGQVLGTYLTPQNMKSLIDDATEGDPYLSPASRNTEGLPEEYDKYANSAALAALYAYNKLQQEGHLKPLDTLPMKGEVNEIAANLAGLNSEYSYSAANKLINPSDFVIYRIVEKGLVVASKGDNPGDIEYLKQLPVVPDDGYGPVKINNWHISGPIGFGAGGKYPYSPTTFTNSPVEK